ncbi:enterochelin esterase domain-containing protein [Cupriavidus sp.]|uniref:enterochelin esterase domain-containing protein n=1 Tax=Cupriavidus sp. TaxID=1873897 RepID=UPI003D147F5C
MNEHEMAYRAGLKGLQGLRHGLAVAAMVSGLVPGWAGAKDSGTAMGATNAGAAKSASAGAALAASDRLEAGGSASGEWRPGTPVAYRLRLARGDLVQGGFEGVPAALDLADAKGRHLRRLAGAGLPTRDFMFVAPEDGDYTLLVKPPEEGAGKPGAQGDAAARSGTPFKVTVSSIVPLKAQHAPADAPESPRLRALAGTLADGGGSAAFWEEMRRQGTPLVEPLGAPGAHRAENGAGDEVLVTFLWRGASHGVRLFGSPAGDHDELARLGDSDVWYRSYRLPASTRLSYQLAPDVPQFDAPAPQRRRAILATAQRDPLNARVFPGGGVDVFQDKSVLELFKAPPQPWVEARAGVSVGTVSRHRFDSRLLGNSRDVYLYRPVGYRPGADGQALLVVFDAHAYVSLVPTPVILDNLIAEGRIPPTAAIIVGNPSAAARGVELPPNPMFARFLAEELMPWARGQGLSAPAGSTVVAGSSFGGLASAYAALRHPELFGNVLSQSGSFWWAPTEGSQLGASVQAREPEWLTREYVAAPRLPVRFYLEAGLFEGARGPGGILSTSRHLRDVLLAKGYSVRFGETASGHDYLHWRGSLACGLLALIGNEKAVGAAWPACVAREQ